MAALALLLTVLPAVAQAAATITAHVWHVATSGADANPGSAAGPFLTVQRAVQSSAPGDQILVHAGTYRGVVSIDPTHSGTAANPIVLTTAGDGPVTLTASFPTIPCSATSPTADRTIQILGGADYWTISGFTIVNGVEIAANQAGDAFRWFDTRVNIHDWAARRAVPGRSTDDRIAAKGAVDYVRAQTQKDIDPADGIKLLDNKITGRGIHARVARSGTISGNDIGPIDCGTGPGVWLIAFSDFWRVTGNHVHDIAASTASHYMQEGIRMGSSSDYNTVSQNVVENLPGDGRGINTDVDSSWNLIRDNRARNVAIGFNDQQSGWGNRWILNRVENARVHAFTFRAKDATLVRPSPDTTPDLTVVDCNVAVGVVSDIQVGGMTRGTFSTNSVQSANLSANLRGYWTAKGNMWNGSSAIPDPIVGSVPPGSCPAAQS